MGIFHGRLKRAGSLQLSINAIVILILAITMLGLGLGFIRKTFGQAEEQLSGVTREIETQMVERLEESGRPIAISQQSIELAPNTDGKVFAGIQNLDPTNPLGSSDITVTPGQKVVGSASATCPTVGTVPSTPELSPGETYTFPLIINAGADTVTCLYDISVTDLSVSLAVTVE